MLNLLGFITTVSMMANSHCLMDGLVLVCLAPLDPGPSLAVRANTVINGLPTDAVVRHLLSVVHAGIMTERRD